MYQRGRLSGALFFCSCNAQPPFNFIYYSSYTHLYMQITYSLYFLIFVTISSEATRNTPIKKIKAAPITVPIPMPVTEL